MLGSCVNSDFTPAFPHIGNAVLGELYVSPYLEEQPLHSQMTKLDDDTTQK